MHSKQYMKIKAMIMRYCIATKEDGVYDSPLTGRRYHIFDNQITYSNSVETIVIA